MMMHLQVDGQALPRGVAAQRGFALIITISLMAFLVLLLITVGTFTRIETEVASYSQKQSIAREHAKMAMEIAVGELQRHAGRDDRVTVRADRFRPRYLSDVGEGGDELHHPFWTAVWNPYEPGRAQAFLVSGNEFYDDRSPSPTMWSPLNGVMNPTIQPTNSGAPEEGFDFFPVANQAGAVSPQGSTIRLVGPSVTSEFVPTYDGATSNVDTLNAYVYAPRIPIRVENYPGLPEQNMSANENQLPEDGHIIGHYAYWVGDEGVKANVSVAGDRYPNEEYENRTDPQGMQDYRDDLDGSWGGAFLPVYWEDDYLRTISPTRFGFSFLNGMWESDPDGDFQYFQDFDPYSPILNERHFNPRLSAWQRVMARGQAVGEESEDFIINPQRNDNPYGFTAGNGNNPGELEHLFHDTTAFSRGVQATTRRDGGLKVDLSRFDGPAWDNAHRAWAQAQAKTVNPDTADSPDSDNPPYPVGIVKPGLGTGSGAMEFEPFASPVVTHLHLSGAVGPAGYDNSIVLQSLEAKIGLWNPYDVEMDLSGIGALGERIEIRLSHPDSSTDDPEPLQMAFGAGLHWLEREDATDPGTPRYGGWLTEHYPSSEAPLDLDFLSREDAGLDPIAFEITDSALNTRFHAGETHLFSSTGNANDGRGEMDRGRNGVPWDLPGAGLDTTIVQNCLYQSRPYDELDFDLQGIRPALYFPNGGRIRVEVVVVREEGAEDVVVHTLLNEVVNIRAWGDLSDDGEVDLAEFVGPFGGTEWPEVWQNDMDDQGLFVYPEWTVSGGSVSGGSPLTFAFGVDSRPLPEGIDDTLDPNLRDMNYAGRGVQEFYTHDIPDVLTWNSNENGYPVVLFLNGGSTGEYPTSSWVTNVEYEFSLEDAEFMTFYHILRNLEQDMSGIQDINGYDWTQWTPLSSVGQLRVRTQVPNASLFDTRFFSTALLPPSADSDWPFFHNPRMQLYVGDEGFSSDVLDRMQNDPDEAAAHVMTEGAFNVNSTSVKAWAALLNSFAEQDLLVFDPDNGGGIVYRHNSRPFGTEELLGGSFSRFTTAPGASYFGRRNIGAGRAGSQRSIWRNGFRELKPLNLEYPHLAEDFDYEFWSAVNDPSSGGAPERYPNAAMAMAEIIVDRIRNHGDPVFGTVADFIGSGILQQAIDGVRWHGINDPEGTIETGLNWYYDAGDTEWRRIPRSSPSYLTQDDLLATLGSVLTARSDTFLIRTYGDSHNPVTGEVEARAWLEAVVQRVPTPVNPDSQGVEPQNPSSDPFGRKFEVIQMRWLDPDEI